jgi:hypothetical protein
MSSPVVFINAGYRLYDLFLERFPIAVVNIAPIENPSQFGLP